MSYITQQTVQDEIGGLNRLIEVLDDNGTGQLDAALLQRLMDSSGQAVEAFLQGRYVIPFAPAPSLVAEANLVFCLEKIYNRRKQGVDEKNPYEPRATEMRQRLKRISDRKESLDAAELPAFTPGAVVQKCSSLNGSSL